MYGYEYLGNLGCLVIIFFIDCCYIILIIVFYLYCGGSFKGFVGIGKIEIVKDFGKFFGMYVIVVNCFEGLDYKFMGKMFFGLV